MSCYFQPNTPMCVCCIFPPFDDENEKKNQQKTQNRPYEDNKCIHVHDDRYMYRERSGEKDDKMNRWIERERKTE